MEERHTRFLNFLIFVSLFIATINSKGKSYNASLLGATVGTAISLILATGGWILSHRSNIRTIVNAIFICNLRISCSYLYRIKVDDHYLLIKSRKHGKYQPVGGNFKRNKFSHATLQKLEVRDDDKFTNGHRSADDLRLYIRGYKLSQFLKWYNSPNKKREVSYDREFYEELVEPGHFSSELFKYPIFNFIKQVITPVRYSTYLKCYEVHIYDIVELNPSHDQFTFLKELKQRGDCNEFKWATSNMIKTQGYQSHTQDTPYEITDHSIEILS